MGGMHWKALTKAAFEKSEVVFAFLACQDGGLMLKLLDLITVIGMLHHHQRAM